MSKFDPVVLFALPPTFKGRALTCLFIISLVFTIVQFGLTADNFGFWQGRILWGMGPLYIIYLVTLIFLLHKSKDETLRTSRIPWCLTRGTNILFIGLCDGVWVAGASIGFWFFYLLDDPTSDWYPTGRALTSTMLGALVHVIFAILIVCIMARRERPRDSQELAMGLTAYPSA